MRRSRIVSGAVLCFALLAAAAAAAAAQPEAGLDPERLAQLDLYQVLGIDKGASLGEVKNAYRKLAKEWHPDKRPESEKDEATKRFAEIGEAYEILSDDSLRGEYDAIREYYASSRGGSGRGGGRAGGGSGGGANYFGFDLGGFGGGFDFHFHDPFSVFNDFFGADFEEMFHGGPREDYYREYDHFHTQQQQQQQYSGTGGAQDRYRNQEGKEKTRQQQQHRKMREESFDYSIAGVHFRTILTSALHDDGFQSSLAKDFEVTEYSLYPIVGVSSFARGSSGFHGPSRVAEGIFSIGDYLPVGFSISSSNGHFALTLQDSCNLVLHRNKKQRTVGGYTWQGRALWETLSQSGTRKCFAILQENGVLAVLEGEGPTTAEQVLWSSPPPASPGGLARALGSPEYSATIQDDGNFVIYRANAGRVRQCVWASFGCNGRVPWKSLWRRGSSIVENLWCELRGECELSSSTDSFQRAASSAYKTAEPVARRLWGGISEGYRAAFSWAKAKLQNGEDHKPSN